MIEPAAVPMLYLRGSSDTKIPLWTPDGAPYFEDDEDLEVIQGVPWPLCQRIYQWAMDWETHNGEPTHDAEAAAIVRELDRWLGFSGQVVYQPTRLGLSPFVPAPGASYVGFLDPGWQPPPAGETLYLMGRVGERVPLVWEERLFDTPEQLIEGLGVSPGLAADLVDWANAWETSRDNREHHALAVELVSRLNAELGGRYRVVYKPAN